MLTKEWLKTLYRVNEQGRREIAEGVEKELNCCSPDEKLELLSMG